MGNLAKRWAAGILGVCGVLHVAAAQEVIAPVVVEFFHEPGCAECAAVEADVLPALVATYGDLIDLRRHDVSREEGYLGLMGHLERLGMDDNASVFVLLDGTRMLAGRADIARGLLAAVDEILAARVAGMAAVAVPDATDVAAGAAARRFSKLTLPGVLVGGLVDGLNPCAVATLVFLVSVLTLSHVRGVRLMAVGLTFCAASFVTYLMIGLGLLHVLYRASVYPAIRHGLDWVLTVGVGVLAGLSFRDAWRYHLTGRSESVVLQLPEGLKRRIRHTLRARLGVGVHLVGTMVAGVVVTGIESVCTGQVLLPTLGFVVRKGTGGMRAIGYLLAYNVMFILPLLVVLVLLLRGLRLERLLAWSERHVIASKVMLGLFFLCLCLLTVL